MYALASDLVDTCRFGPGILVLLALSWRKYVISHNYLISHPLKKWNFGTNGIDVGFVLSQVIPGAC